MERENWEGILEGETRGEEGRRGAEKHITHMGRLLVKWEVGGRVTREAKDMRMRGTTRNLIRGVRKETKEGAGWENRERERLRENSRMEKYLQEQLNLERKEKNRSQ